MYIATYANYDKNKMIVSVDNTSFLGLGLYIAIT